MNGRGGVACFLLYLALTWVLLLPLSAHPSERMPDDGDSVQVLWIVWWVSSHIAPGSTPGVLDANVYYPHPQGLLYSEPMLSQGLLGWPFFYWLSNRVLAMNLLLILTLALTATAAHLFLRELSGSHAAAFIGALYYTFNSYNLSHLPRLQLVSLQWMPLALLCLSRFFSRGENRHLIGFFAWSLLHALACLYYLLFYGIALTVLLPTYIWVHRHTLRPVAFALFAVGCALFIGAVAAVLLPHMSLYALYEFASQPRSYDLGVFFSPSQSSLLHTTTEARLVENSLGYVSLALGGFGAWVVFRRWREGQAVAFAYLLVGLLGLVLAGGPEPALFGHSLGPGPYSVLQLLSPFQKLRDVDRFALLTRLALSFFLAVGAAALFERWRGRVRAFAVAILGLLVVFEHWSFSRTRGKEVPVGAQVPEVYSHLAAGSRSEPVAELPPQPFRRIRFTAFEAYFSTFHEHPILWGKPSFYPPALELLQWQLRGFPDQRSLALLQGLDVRLALVHPKRWGGARRQARALQAIGDRRDVLEPLQAFPDRSDNPLWEKYQLGGERLYAIRPARGRLPPRDCECLETAADSYRLRSFGATVASHAKDRDRKTRWTTGRSQRKGDFIDVIFDEPRRVARVELEMSYPYGEFARNLAFAAVNRGEESPIASFEDLAYQVDLVKQLVRDPSKARLRYDLEPTTVELLRIFIAETEEGAPAWSIPEIHVYEMLSRSTQIARRRLELIPRAEQP